MDLTPTSPASLPYQASDPLTQPLAPPSLPPPRDLNLLKHKTEPLAPADATTLLPLNNGQPTDPATAETEDTSRQPNMSEDTPMTGTPSQGSNTVQQTRPPQHCPLPVDSMTVDTARPGQEMEAQGATRISTHPGHLSLSPTSPAMDEASAQSPRSSLSATSYSTPNNQPMDVTDNMSLTSADSSSSALPATAYCNKPWSKQASPARILTARKLPGWPR